MWKGDTLYFSPSISAGIQKKNVPCDSCYLYTTLVVKSPAFLEEKFFTRCEVQDYSIDQLANSPIYQFMNVGDKCSGFPSARE